MSGPLLFIGTQCTLPGEGIFAARLDEATGQLTSLGVAAGIERPTWLLADPVRPILFAVSEVGNRDGRPGAVASFAITGPEGQLQLLGQTESGGGGATHLDLTPGGGTLFVANFGGGSAAALPVTADGSIGPLASLQATSGTGPHRRQQGPHPHGVTLDPSGRFLLVPDMGADRIFLYRYDAATRALTPVEPPSVPLPAGSGPRLILFSPHGRFAWLLTELSAELYSFAWDAEAGHLTQLACTPLDPPGADDARSAAVLLLSRDGRFLYASNRITNEIQAYAVDRDSGLLTEIQRIAAGGEKPWGGAISPDGRWLVVANQASDNVAAFAIDEETGRLTSMGEPLTIPTPTGIAFA